MTAVSLFEAATGSIAKRARAEVDGERVRVRRHSYYPEDRRALARWKRIERSPARGGMTVSDRLRAAEKFDREHRKRGERMGPLGPIGLDVLRVMYFTVDYASGRLEPSIDWLCGKVKRARSAVTKALARLKEHGWLDWTRRAQPIEEADGQRGPQIEQIPNAYELTLPQPGHAAHVYLAEVRQRRSGPLPVDDADRRAADAADLTAMQDSLPLDELPHVLGREASVPPATGVWGAANAARAAAESDELAAILSRYGASVSASNASTLKGQNPASQGEV